MSVKGLDLSKYQNGIDFKEIVDKGYKFVILRVGYRGYGNGKIVKDPCFDSFYNQAKQYNLGVGVYFFSQAISKAEAIEEAEWTLEQIKDKQLEYPVYIDQEYGNNTHTGRADYNSNRVNTDVIQAFCNRIEEGKFYSGYYVSQSWYYNKIFYKELSMYDNWIAKWSVLKTNVPCGMWQNTNSLKIGSFRVDGNIAYKDYPTIMKNNSLNNFSTTKLYDIHINKITQGDVKQIENLLKVLQVDYKITEV